MGKRRKAVAARRIRPVTPNARCGRIASVEQSSNQPIHWDTHRGSLNFTLILSVAVVVLGVWNFVQTGEWILIIVGVGVGAFTWLTNPRQYWIYPDALIIVYGRPRTRTISFNQVSHVELLSLPIGDRLRVTLVNGRRVMVQPRESETFQDRLEGALRSFHGSEWRNTVIEERPLQDSPGEGAQGGEPRERERLTLETVVQDPPAVETPEPETATESAAVQDPPAATEVEAESPAVESAPAQEDPVVESQPQEPATQDGAAERETAGETTVQEPVAQETTAEDEGSQETASEDADEDDGQTREPRRRRPVPRRRRRRSASSDS